jgi:hypothetical protein
LGRQLCRKQTVRFLCGQRRTLVISLAHLPHIADKDFFSAKFSDSQKSHVALVTAPHKVQKSPPQCDSCALLVMSEKAWYIPYIYTEETRPTFRARLPCGPASGSLADYRCASMPPETSPPARSGTATMPPLPGCRPPTARAGVGHARASLVGPARSSSSGDPNVPAQTSGVSASSGG